MRFDFSYALSAAAIYVAKEISKITKEEGLASNPKEAEASVFKEESMVIFP